MNKEKIKIAIAGTGYVGLSNAVLLSQHHEVWAVDIIQEKKGDGRSQGNQCESLSR